MILVPKSEKNQSNHLIICYKYAENTWYEVSVNSIVTLDEDIETIESQTLYNEGTIDRKNYKGESAINYGFESVWNAEKQQLEYTFYFQGEKEEGTVL